MRILTAINDFSDIYQPVLLDDIQTVETELNFVVPDALRRLYLHPDREQIKSLPTLLWPVLHDSVGIIEANKSLQSKDYDPYPSYLIAFATNECGDYWVIDTRDQSIRYIDPDKEMEENLTSEDLNLPDFNTWLEKGGKPWYM